VTPAFVAGLRATGLAVAVLTAVIAAHVALRRAIPRSRTGPGDGVSTPVFALLAFVGAGAVGVLAADEARGVVLPGSPALFGCAAAAFYLAGLLAYLEARSLLSRGYSLRILMDIAEHGRSIDISALKAYYGAGMGIEGLLGKRLHSLARLGLLRVHNGLVGPLTGPGRVAAAVTSGVRRLLRLELVG
jgi:hypothetical protein